MGSSLSSVSVPPISTLLTLTHHATTPTLLKFLSNPKDPLTSPAHTYFARSHTGALGSNLLDKRCHNTHPRAPLVILKLSSCCSEKADVFAQPHSGTTPDAPAQWARCLGQVGAASARWWWSWTGLQSNCDAKCHAGNTGWGWSSGKDNRADCVIKTGQRNLGQKVC